MWLWVVVAVAAAVHAAVIDENENRRIRDAKDEIFNKYKTTLDTKKRKKQRVSVVSFFFAVRNSGLYVRQTLRFCRPSLSDSSRPVSYRKRKKMPASWFQSRFSWNQENHVFPELCLFRQSGFA